MIAYLKGKEKIRVLFVCLGNICRSPAAEGVMREVVKEGGDADRWEIDSAGMGGWHVGDLPDKRMRIHGRDRGYDFNHICRKVRPSDFDNFDLIIGMDSMNIADLNELAPTEEAQQKIVPMAAFVPPSFRSDAVPGFYPDCIPDPYYEGSAGFELVLDLLEDACRNLHNQLT